MMGPFDGCCMECGQPSQKAQQEREALERKLANFLARAERAEAEQNSRAEAVSQAWRVKLANSERERDEALALADARGRALEGCIKALENGRYRREERQGALDALTVAWDALSTPAPEAMRRQLEREAEKDALIEALLADLSMIHDQAEEPDGHPDILRMATRALNLTPPQALREREERVGVLEKAYVRFKAIVDGLDCACDDGFTCTLHADRRLIESIDAKKGTQP